MALTGRFPHWLRKPLVVSGQVTQTRELLAGLDLHTVCQEAQCPNQTECFSRRTATFLILGNTCTRQCAFCAVSKGAPPAMPEPDEPARLAAAAVRLGLQHVVVTSVTRDDLPDGGAAHFAAVVRSLRKAAPQAVIEVLTPDFQGQEAAIAALAAAQPDVFNHNVETVPRLYPRVRPQADFVRSINLLKKIKDLQPAMTTKSGLMVGLGESRDEVLETMGALRQAGCAILTIGQYLRPGPEQLPVVEYVPPETYKFYTEKGIAMGFEAVSAGPWVRSSYRAGEIYRTTKEIGRK